MLRCSLRTVSRARSGSEDLVCYPLRERARIFYFFHSIPEPVHRPRLEHKDDHNDNERNMRRKEDIGQMMFLSY